MAEFRDLVATARKTLTMCEPHLMAFTHILKHEEATPAHEAKKILACTDGFTVWYSKAFTGLTPPERAYVHAHELIHGIFMHPDRAQLIRLTRGFINFALFNYAADAITNEGIESNPAMPSGMFTPPAAFPPVKMAFIHEAMKEAIDFSGEAPPSNYDSKALKGLQVEVIYDWLMWALDAVKRARKSSDTGTGNGPGGSRADEDDSDGASHEGQGGAAKQNPQNGLTQIERMAKEAAWDLQEQIGRLKELLDDGATSSELIDKINSRMEDARIRIEQVIQGLKLQGHGQSSLLLELATDLPKPVIPWNRHIRRLTTRGLGTRLNDSYVRYGSNTMTALARRERIIPFSPGTTIFTERPRVLVILDVSGSHIGELPACFAEISSIARMKGAVVDVLTFDDGVQEVLEIKSMRDFLTVMQRGIKGGGGTSLQGVWDRVAKMRDPYRMAVIMTDGYLDEGKNPRMPVIWMVTAGGKADFSFGEVICLPATPPGASRKAA